MQVTFEEEQLTVHTKPVVATGLIGFLIRRGWVRNSAQAQAVLILVILICLGITFLVLITSNNAVEEEERIPLDPEQGYIVS